MCNGINWYLLHVNHRMRFDVWSKLYGWNSMCLLSITSPINALRPDSVEGDKIIYPISTLHIQCLFPFNLKLYYILSGHFIHLYARQFVSLCLFIAKHKFTFVMRYHSLYLDLYKKYKRHQTRVTSSLHFSSRIRYYLC